MAKINAIIHQLHVQLPKHKYPIYIGKNLLSDAHLLIQQIRAQQVLIVTNEVVAPLYLHEVQQTLAALQCDVVVLPDGEQYKNQSSLNLIYDALIRKHHHRDTTLLALGGGVIGDLTGFAAATYQRGVRFIQLPTTLLSQVDASVGGKTGINYLHAKNMIGSFHQPHAVFIDLNTLETLPMREFRAGLGEVIKYGLLAGGDLFEKLNALVSMEFSFETCELYAALISECCQIKARIVEEDEREVGCRALLNLGHTFAHALEAATDYQCWLHGEAVGIGLYCAALLSHQLGYLDKTDLDRVDSLLMRAQLPRRIPRSMDLQQLYRLMFNDKKINNQQLRFILLSAPGQCFIDEHVTNDCLRHVLSLAVEGENNG